MRQDRHICSAFALYEVLLGVTIFVIGVLALGRSVENCLNASALSEEENRVRQILANRMAEIQTAPLRPDNSRETKIDTGYGIVKLSQKSADADLIAQRDTMLDDFGAEPVLHPLVAPAGLARGAARDG